MHPRTSLFRALRASILLGLASFACLTLGDAHAAWPPPAGADMKDPANWPNDPGYGGCTPPSMGMPNPCKYGSPNPTAGVQWNLYGFLPPQLPGTAPYLSADQKLGASGMRIDEGWTYTVGSPDVKIAICDSGLEWDDTDLVNKAYLNAGELTGTARPQNPAGNTTCCQNDDGTSCAGATAPSCGGTSPGCGGKGALAGYDCNCDGHFSLSDYMCDPRITTVVPGGVCYVPGSSQVATGAPRLMGDVNANCIIDPGDLIQLFSNKVDDDGNGYTDDISGWDFFKNDNNPYDDTRYGHGTGESRDSSAGTNNNQGDAGVCPNCRFMMLRAGNSFIADANDFAKGVVYAADNGVNIIQEALGTIDQTAFSRAAIDYAYGKGVTIIASMADENSRHHNMPGVWNHTLPVHAITYMGPSYNTATSFLGFNDCTNFGGQLGLSTSGSACSSEATGKTSGIAGLVISYAEQQGMTLTPEEVMQLLKQTADTINVPQSNTVANLTKDYIYYQSLPYWSQRFGYGRPNVQRAMQTIQNKMIPPEVEITSPLWFQTLYADRVSGPVPILGRVVAARAMTYDFTIEWAPGVEPSDSEFTTLMSMVSNVPGKTVSGGPTSPLAMIDPRDVNTKHVPDPDSPHHENDRTVTLRIRAVAHYMGGDATGEARRSIAIVNQMNGLDDDLLPGFPVTLPASAESGPKLADINGDGIRDIILGATDGSINVYSVASGMPVPIAGFPYMTRPIDGLDPTPADPTLPSYLTAPAYANGKNGGISPAVTRESILGSPAIGDVNLDGSPDIAFATWPGTIYLIDAKGHDLPGWPIRLPLVPSCPMDPSAPRPPGDCMDFAHNYARGAYGSPVLYDMNGDGKIEIIVAAFDGNIYIYHSDGTPMAGWPVRIHDPQYNPAVYNRIMTTPTIGDFNHDGIPDIGTGSNEELGGGGAGPVFVVDGRGMNAPGGPYLKNWPLAVTSLHLFPVVAEGIDSSLAAVNLDGSGDAVLIMGNGSTPLLVAGDPGVQVGLNAPPGLLPRRSKAEGNGFDATNVFGHRTDAMPDTMFPLFSQPSIGDLDQDGTPDIVLSGGSLTLAGNLAGGYSARPFQHLLAFWNGKTGHMFPGSPAVIEDYTFLTSEAIADITGDGYPEIIEGNGGYFVHAIDACGREAAGWPKFTDGWMTATPAVGDITGDHSLAVVSTTRDGYLYAWKTKGSDTGVVQWESFHHDNANTGNYGTKLDQGFTKVASKVLDCNAMPSNPPPGKMPPTTNYAPTGGGGCSCRAAGAAGAAGAADANGALGWLVAAVAGLAMRRKRSASRS